MEESADGIEDASFAQLASPNQEYVRASFRCITLQTAPLTSGWSLGQVLLTHPTHHLTSGLGVASTTSSLIDRFHRSASSMRIPTYAALQTSQIQ
jgi:hypothetical protein